MTENDGLRDLARLLLSVEAEGDSDPSGMADALDRVCRKLTVQLAPVIGDLGVRLTVRRAAAITRANFPFLAADSAPGDDEYLKELRESLRGQDPALATEALTSLLANLLALLLGLLGKNLTYLFLREAWPEVAIS